MTFRAAHSLLAVVMTVVLATSCSSESADPESWTMSPDSFGPITTDMTKAEILETGAYRVAPSPCSFGRLDWHTQKYESVDDLFEEDRETHYGRVGPGLPSISLDGHGKPEYIDRGPRTMTDKGIGTGDTLKELKAAYGERLIPDELEIMDDYSSFAVNGKEGHLVFDVSRGKVRTFYLTPGRAKKPWGADMRGIGC